MQRLGGEYPDAEKADRRALGGDAFAQEGQGESRRPTTTRGNRRQVTRKTAWPRHFQRRGHTMRVTAWIAVSIIELGVVVVLSVLVGWLVLYPIPTTAEIDADLDQVRKEIKQVSAEADKYAPSLLKSLIEL